MSHQGKKPQDQLEDLTWNYENSVKHWRRWGSWFSWGSPVGLGLFCISVAIALWILSQAFGWK